jgi:hypothetical protein
MILSVSGIICPAREYIQWEHGQPPMAAFQRLIFGNALGRVTPVDTAGRSRAGAWPGVKTQPSPPLNSALARVWKQAYATDQPVRILSKVITQARDHQRPVHGIRLSSRGKMIGAGRTLN